MPSRSTEKSALRVGLQVARFCFSQKVLFFEVSIVIWLRRAISEMGGSHRPSPEIARPAYSDDSRPCRDDGEGSAAARGVSTSRVEDHLRPRAHVGRPAA